MSSIPSENLPLSTRNNLQNPKKNFYDFRNIYKIEDFYCFSDHNSCLNYHPNISRTNNTTNGALNHTQVMNTFKKDITTYLIVKKHYEANTNKYFSLISKLESFKRKKKHKKSLSLNNILINDSILEHSLENDLHENNEKKLENKKQVQFPLEIYRFSELRGDKKEKILVNLEFFIEGDRKVLKKKVDLKRLEKRFLKKNEGFLNSKDHTKDEIIDSLARGFENVLHRLKKKPFELAVPTYFRPLMQSFNDFYQYDESFKPEDEKRESHEKKSEKDVEKEFEELLIEQILNETTKENSPDENSKFEELIVEKALPKYEQAEEESIDSSDSEKEREEELEINSHKVHQKMQKYLSKKNPTSPSSIVVGPSLNQPSPNLTKKPAEVEEEKGEIRVKATKPEEEENATLKIEKGVEFDEEQKRAEEFEKIQSNSKMEVIDRLLESKDIFNEDLSVLFPKNFAYPEIPKDLKFSDDSEREIFQRVFHWLYEVEIQIEKDKSDIEHYEKDYQMKFMEYLRNEQASKIQNEDSRSSGGSEIEDEEEDEESDGEEK